jgi:hypothetical protein
VRVLTPGEMHGLFDHARPAYRAAPCDGDVQWSSRVRACRVAVADVRFEEGVIGVLWQVNTSGKLVEPKTPQAKRNIVMPSLAKVLREHLAASPHCCPTDFVFASATGRPLDPRNLAQRGLREAAEAAELVPKREPKKSTSWIAPMCQRPTWKPQATCSSRKDSDPAASRPQREQYTRRRC